MNKKNLVLGGILAALIIIAFVSEGPLKDWRAKLGKVENILATVDFSQVSRIDINRSGEAFSIEKDGDRWKIAGTKGFYVRDDIIQGIELALNAVKEADVLLASENEAKKDDFEVGESGTSISLRQGDTLLYEFIVGKVGVDFTSTYITKNDTPKTYLIKANLNSALVRSDWYDPIILKGDIEKISKLRFQHSSLEFTAELQEDEWQGILPYKFDVDEEKIGLILESMSNLIAADIPEQTFEGTGFDKDIIIIQATGEDIDSTIMIGGPQAVDAEEEVDSEDILYYAKRADSDNIYLISAEQKELLDVRIQDLR
ncbi:DUF4340 domain-containing protein [Candidatus Parcubacteria bacterium]|nr:DUF4340 domain-containing protein [Candidatus Parcubacteria bacterium]